jgi:hypothetical protein
MASAGTANPAAAVPSYGNTSPARGSVHLAVCGHRVLPRRAVIGNGNMHALMRAAFATLTSLCFVLLRNEIEHRQLARSPF